MQTVDPLAGISAFLAVAEALSFSRAAEALELSRATVSAQVQALEARLGVRLFQRSTRTVALTEAGQAYRQALGGVLPQIREAERAAASYQKEAVGRLRVSAAPDLGPDHIVPAATEFLRLNPGVSLELDLSHGTVNLIEEGFDLAIRGTITVEPNLVTRRIGASPVLVCASPAYLERCGMPAHPTDLTRHACLHFSPLRWGPVWQFRRTVPLRQVGTGEAGQVEAGQVEAGQGEAGQAEPVLRVPILPRLASNDSRSLVAAALAGLGIALEPAFVVGPAIRAGRLVPVLTDWSVVTVPVHAVYPANRHIAVKVRSFVGFLADRLADHPDLSYPMG